MSEILNAVDSVYAKWEQKPTVNGGAPSKPQFNSNKSVGSVLDNGRKAWKTKFDKLPPRPERRTRSARAAPTKGSRSVDDAVSLIIYF